MFLNIQHGQLINKPFFQINEIQLEQAANTAGEGGGLLCPSPLPPETKKVIYGGYKTGGYSLNLLRTSYVQS
jgi:hypothetical protein